MRKAETLTLESHVQAAVAQLVPCQNFPETRRALVLGALNEIRRAERQPVVGVRLLRVVPRSDRVHPHNHGFAIVVLRDRTSKKSGAKGAHEGGRELVVADPRGQAIAEDGGIEESHKQVTAAGWGGGGKGEVD